MSLVASNAGWIDRSTASKRSGKSVGHITRLCRDKWAGEQLARQEQGPNGGKPTWFVREDADPAFALVKFPEQIGTDLRNVPKPKRDEAIRRRGILLRWEEHLGAAAKLGGFSREAATNHFIERLLLSDSIRISMRTLYRWHTDYRAGGLIALVDGRGVKDEAPKDDPFLAEVIRLWLNQGKPTIALCRRMVCYTAREQSWVVRNYKACQRAIEAIPAAVVYKKRGGEEAYVNHAEPYLERDYTTLASNELWCSDHHQFDVVVSVLERLDSSTGEAVKVHKRPWMTAFQDVRSRKILAWRVYAHDPNSDEIFSVFREAVIDHGIPSNLLIDNGADYDCYDLNGRTKKDRWRKRRVKVELNETVATGLFGELKINTGHALPYHGQSKPIERWFGVVETETVFWPTYCGNKPANRPDDFQLELERGNAPTLEEFADWVDQLIVSYNAGHAHSGQGMDGQTPDYIYDSSWMGTSRRTARRELLDLLCLKRLTVKVGQNGVTWKGLRFGQYEPAIQRLLGQDVLLRVDERDISQVFVHSADDKLFVCIAPCNQLVPANASAQELRQAMGLKRQSRKLLKEYVQHRPRMTDDLPTLMLRAAAERAQAAKAEQGERGDPPPGPNLRPFRHHLEDQLPAVQRAVEAQSKRIAVGAESMSRGGGGPFTYERSNASDTDSPDAGMSFRDLMAGKPLPGDSDHE